MVHRRRFLGTAAAGLFGPAYVWAGDAPAAAADRLSIGAAWRGPAEGDAHHVGVLEVDWSATTMRIKHAAPVPTRPHGLLPEAEMLQAEVRSFLALLQAEVLQAGLRTQVLQAGLQAELLQEGLQPV